MRWFPHDCTTGVKFQLQMISSAGVSFCSDWGDSVHFQVNSGTVRWVCECKWTIQQTQEQKSFIIKIVTQVLNIWSWKNLLRVWIHSSLCYSKNVKMYFLYFGEVRMKTIRVIGGWRAILTSFLLQGLIPP